MKVTEPIIKLCLAELTKQAAAKQRYKDFYDGRHAILTDYAIQDSRSNRKLVFNFPASLLITRPATCWVSRSTLSPKALTGRRWSASAVTLDIK